MASTTAGGSDGIPRLGEVDQADWVSEEVVPDEPPQEGEVIDDDELGDLPDSANEADVVEQRIAVAVEDDDDLDRGTEE
jgi:hypothetical protein